MSFPPTFRVVVFTGGAELQRDVLEFVGRLERSSEVELVGIFCETKAFGLRGVISDLWARRGLLAVPLLLLRWLRKAWSTIFAPGQASLLRQTELQIEDRLRHSTDLHSPDIVAEIRDLRPDLGLVYGGPILRPELFNSPKEGTLGIHHGKTPGYRGKKTTFWAIYNGETHVAVTIQRIGPALDGGDVVLEASLPVGKSLPFILKRRLEELGLDLYCRAILQVKYGEAVFTPQPVHAGRLYRDPTLADILRFWIRYLLRVMKRTQNI